MPKAIIVEDRDTKRFISDDVNYLFNRKTGFMATWGKTYDDDPIWSPAGPFIADIEVTTICNGPAGKVCPFCYKGNTPRGENMSFETFKIIFDKLPRTLTQIAFGADATLKANPDIWKMFDYARENKVIPNVTVANVDELTAVRLAGVCGGVAVSRYSDKNWCYDSVARLTGAGQEQVVIHQLLSKETMEAAIETINDVHTDERLRHLKAIVFLSLKPKKRGEKFNRLTQDEFKQVVDHARAKGVPFGFDSCSSNKFIAAVKDDPVFNRMVASVEPCEATCFSFYVDVKGEYFPCSFTPGLLGWDRGVDVVDAENFLEDVWNAEKTKGFREQLNGNKCEAGCRSCILYKI